MSNCRFVDLVILLKTVVVYLKAVIYTAHNILGYFSVAKVIIIFEINKHINDFLRKKIIAYLEKRKSPCSGTETNRKYCKGNINIGDILFRVHPTGRR